MSTLDELRMLIEGAREEGHNGSVLADLMEKILDAATLRPCHVTGMHTPNHHLNGTVCSHMEADTAQRVVEALGLDIQGLPHELHPAGTFEEGGCRSCHHIPGEQKYRDEMIANWAWADRTPTAEMLEPGTDMVLPGDTALVLSVLTDQWMSWQDAISTLGKIQSETVGTRVYFSSDRYWKVIRNLAAEGRVEQRDISVRLPQKKVSA